MSRGVRRWWCVLGVLAAACGSEVDTTAVVAQEIPEETDGKYPREPAQVEERTVSRWVEEPPGLQCTAGGTAIQIGVDLNGNGTLEDEEVRETSYTCHGGIRTEPLAGAETLLSLAPEPAGTNCTYGGTRVRNGIDNNGNGILEQEETVQTQFVCASPPPYPTNWAASSPNPVDSGLIPTGFWVPSGRKVIITKTSAESRIKITVSDNFSTGYGTNGGYGYYEVRMNGGTMSPRCHQGQYSANTAGWSNYHRFPFSTVCLTDVLPVGVYEFETWVYASVGQAIVGTYAPQALVLAEEVQATSNYGFSREGGVFFTDSKVFQRVPGRTVTYTKRSQGTVLKITLADTLRTGVNQNWGYGTVIVRMDNADTSCYTVKYNHQGSPGDMHDPFVMTCILPDVSAGAHTFSVWLRADSGAAAYLGWERPNPLLMVEEIFNQNMAYALGGGSGEVGGDWSGVSGRWLLHTIQSTGRTLRVTYSDTFRSALNCNGYWGLFQLYVDNQPTGCINGQYAYNSGGASGAQNHHRPINHVCLIKNLPPGPHTFSIWSSTKGSPSSAACGTNYFGWNRGQPLLLLEELP